MAARGPQRPPACPPWDRDWGCVPDSSHLFHGQSPMECYDAIYEDENGDLPAGTPPYPGVRGIVKLEKAAMLRDSR